MKTHEWTEEKIEFLRKSMETMSTRECSKAFSEKFAEPLGQTHLRRVLTKFGIPICRKSNDFLPVGTERYNKYYDCMMVKVGDCHVRNEISVQERDRKRNANWKMKQNLVWERTTGKSLPWRWCVVFLDGNRMNYDPSNLYAVPLQVIGTIEKMRMHSENPEIYKTALIWGQLYFTLKEVNGREISL